MNVAKLCLVCVVSVAALLAFGSPASADSFAGSWQVDDGLNWTTNPDVYSAQEAAAFLFGGLASDYRISIDSSLDPSTITDTGWYSRVGIGGGHEYAHDFSQDLGGLGYAAPGWQDDDDISAYVDDNAIGVQYTNYAWRVDAVPEPGSLALVGFALLGFGIVRRKRRAPAE